ncbi:IS1380 family transposase [Solitalea lacus]|uniref:IS1380 family transposase n=1 Tax=Solitalea lacus TaxID=2911172 RepID=UPI001EDC878B|nr:IS1380 family transposase [Solitalea lacus]UKJ08392.1 IS1380 family transposase [Solitalea lacus]
MEEIAVSKPYLNLDLKIDFTDKEITPWSGIVLLKKMLDRMEFEAALDRLPLPAPGSNRGYSPHQLIQQFMTSIWCGANKFEHCEVTRHDAVMKQCWGFKQMAGSKAIQRFFNKHTLATNQQIFTPLYQWFFGNLQYDNYTLDVDSTILTRYGGQQGSKKGYNPLKPGRNSHHPLIAFIEETKMVANFWLRSGDSYTSNNFQGFLADTIEKLNGKKIGLFRADSGFYGKEVFEYLEQSPQVGNYIIAARQYKPIQQKLAAQQLWVKVTAGIEVAESTYQSPLWDQPRRLVMVRQQVSERPCATGKTLKLFEDEGIYKNYRYSCFVTDLTLPALQVWNLYRQRANCENRIKELKYDFGADSFNLKNFDATEAALNWVMMAYNFISLFRQVVLNTQVEQRLKTLRYKVFAIGGYMVKNGSQKILKLSLAMKRREWFTGLWNCNKTFDLTKT